ncbi:uridine kinase [Halioxenophilus sp. WMMB6]|uniref:uridine kinase n=1 Tax=Halioxenophilus sp. WMMB6 TaxID=3073815 RepID=UPI00295F0DA1|nr:uridine kinase [Halioxenophilus sp. WMMB6]
MTKAHIIAVAGGSCSGKTTMALNVCRALGAGNCAIVYQDSYYRGLASITNYDLPEAIDFQLMATHLNSLKQGEIIAMPTYDFTTHRRTEKQVSLDPKPIILVDGILILHAPELANCFDFKVFVECSEEERRKRRLERDTRERGRTKEETLQQFNNQVAPLHNQLVEPSKQHADFICQQPGPARCDETLSAPLLEYCKRLLP